MSCAAVVESFVAFLDGETDAGERRTIEQHVAGCPSCAGELELLRATRALVARQLGSAGAARSAGSFDELWQRIEADRRPLRVVARGAGRRPARRLAVWMGTGGLALAAGLALMVVGLQPSGSPPAVAPPSAAVGARAAPGDQANGARRAAPRVVAQAHAKQGTQLAKRAPAPHGAEAGDETADQQVAEVANEIDPPAELLERPDLFLNYPVVRKLDELQHLESVLADPGDEGGAG